VETARWQVCVDRNARTRSHLHVRPWFVVESDCKSRKRINHRFDYGSKATPKKALGFFESEPVNRNVRGSNPRRGANLTHIYC
jgi:hypothetical protein